MSSFEKYGAKFDAADPSGGNGPKFPPGTYPKVRIEDVKMHQARTGEDFFIVSGTVLETNNPACPVGTKADWVCNMKHDSSPGNVKSFAGALMGVRGDDEIKRQITTGVITHLISPAQPGRGRVVGLQVVTIQTKRGSDFNKHIWTVCDGGAPALAAAPALPAVPAVAPALPPPPVVPAAPALPPPPPAPPAFPPAGWLAHPTSPGWCYNQSTNEVLSETDLRNRFGLV
jgi:hypothetical protein